MSNNSIELSFGEGINVKHAEAAVLRLGSPDSLHSSVFLDFSACKHIDAGVGWRLGNALRPHSMRGALTARVPRVSSRDDFGGQWFLTFTRSGLGQALSARASLIISDGIDVTQLITDYYDRLDNDTLNNFASLSRLTSPNSLDVDDFDAFIRQFGKLASRVGITAESARRQDLRILSKLCFEAVQNIRDHADRSPLPADTPIASRFSLSYYKVLSRLAPWPGDFRGYVERTEAHLGGRAENPGFIEIVVADDGVGIAARQTLNAGIYELPIDEERYAFDRALLSGNSVKLVAKDTTVRGDPGYGFTYIVEALRSLHAYAVLRSGRLLATFDGTTNASGFDLLSEDFGCLPGAVLDVIFPKPSSQLRLPGM